MVINSNFFEYLFFNKLLHNDEFLYLFYIKSISLLTKILKYSSINPANVYT